MLTTYIEYSTWALILKNTQGNRIGNEDTIYNLSNLGFCIKQILLLSLALETDLSVNIIYMYAHIYLCQEYMHIYKHIQYMHRHIHT